MTIDDSRESLSPNYDESGETRGANQDQPSHSDDGLDGPSQFDDGPNRPSSFDDGPNRPSSFDDGPNRPYDSEDGSPSRGDDDVAETPAGSAPQGSESDASDRPRRRRGSRGGRRRRGRKTDDESAHARAATRSGTDTEADLFGSEVAGSDAVLEARAPRTAQSGIAPREIGFEGHEPDFSDDEDAALEHDDVGAHASVVDGIVTGAPRKKRRRRGRRRGQRGDAGGGAVRAPARNEAADGPVEPPFAEDDDLPPRPRGRLPRELDAAHGEDESRDDDHHDGEMNEDGELESAGTFAAGERPAGGGKKRRRRGTRGGRGRKKVATAERPRHAPQETAAEVETIPGEDDDLPLVADRTAKKSVGRDGDDERGGGRGRKRGRRARGQAREEEFDDEGLPAVPESQRTSLILVNATDPEEHRVAVVEGERIVDFQMTVRDQDSLVNDIYRGRVVNLEPAIGAAFIDFGQGRNGFLHTSDVLSMYGEKDWSLDKLLSAQIDPDEWDSGSSQPGVGAEFSDDDGAEKGNNKKQRRPRPEKQRRFRARPRLPITDLLKKGQMVVVQVTKDAIGDKGPTLTTYISIPGRYLVLMPSMSRTGVSRKIEDEKERKRLKRILTSLEMPDGMGVIVRTAGVGHSKDEIKRDLDYLKGAWDAFGKRLGSGHGPAPLYRESDVAIRTMRDLFTPTTKAVVVDDPEVHRHITEFTEQLMPENVERVKLHTGQRPLFQSYGIEPDFEKIFSRRIELPSGGSVVFDSAEALVAIDVNSGRTRSDGFDFEEIALKTNIEAVPEIARQIRLRDLGGIIVVDFIDMMKMSNIRTVERAFKTELDGDRARSKIGRISQFGLLELTRQRLGPGIAKKAFHSCPRCRGTGRIRTVNSRAAAILRRLGAAMTLKGFSTVEVKAHPEVVRYLKDACSEYIRALEYRFTREVKLYEAPEQHEDSILRYLRADGREVRPGGRRKR